MKKLFDYEKAVKRWERMFKKKMSWKEEVMFNWGYVFAVSDILNKKERGRA